MAPESVPFDLGDLAEEVSRVRAGLDALRLPCAERPQSDGRPGFLVERPPLALLQLFASLDLYDRRLVWTAWGVRHTPGLGPDRRLEIANRHNVTRTDSVLVSLPNGFGCRATARIRQPGHVRSLLTGVVADLEEACAPPEPAGS